MKDYVKQILKKQKRQVNLTFSLFLENYFIGGLGEN